MNGMQNVIDDLCKNRDLPDDALKELIESKEAESFLFEKADSVRRKHYGTDVYIRGLIEFTNYCKNNCNYCGIRKGNQELVRYRLSKKEILSCCENGYALGFRTFVLQGGEDPYYTDEILCGIISEIRKKYFDAAITLSFGEQKRESYQKYFDAGANRYLLRHETVDELLYQMWHPENMSIENRKKCLWDLKEIGFQVGSGIMVGAPNQSTEVIIEDLRFLQELQPDMIGIGPYISHRNTPFSDYQSGDMHVCLRLISILRLMFPYALIPATTALGTIDAKGRELGLQAGANVVMPNLSPITVRKKYELYDNKICTDEEAAECLVCLNRRISNIGYQLVTDRGDVKLPQ